MAFAADQLTVIACVPTAIPVKERLAHFALAKRLLTEGAVHREQLPNGYAFRFPAEMFASVAEFVANERKCCPFMRFDISVPESAEPVLLRMTGPEGTREVIDAELNLSTCAASGCGCSK